MKFTISCLVLLATVYVASSRVISESDLLQRLVKRQAYNDRNCDPRSCAVPNCGVDFVAVRLPGECCERCVPWEYARNAGLQVNQGPQAVQDYRNPQPQYDPYNQQNRVDVYIYGPDEGARVSNGQSIYFDCEVIAPYNQQAQPRWTRAGNQPLPHRAQSTVLPGNRKLARLTIPDATHADAGRYECSAGTGNSRDQASIDLQVTDGGYYPRPQPQPQPQPQPYDPYNQYPYNQPGRYTPAPQPQPQPRPQPQPAPQPQPQPQPDAAGDEGEEGGDEGAADGEEDGEPAAEDQNSNNQPSDQNSKDPVDEGEYPEDYTENE